MIKSTMLYIIFCLIIAFSTGWVFIFKKFIYDKFIFLILNATKYLNENNLTINKGFLKKTFFRNAGLYTLLLAPIYIFCYSFVLYIFFNKKLTYINEIFKYISFFCVFDNSLIFTYNDSWKIYRCKTTYFNVKTCIKK